MYESEVDHSDDRVCPQCGLHPAPSIEELSSAQDRAVEAPLSVPMAEVDPSFKHHPKRSYKKLITVLKILAIWLVLIGLIVGGANMIWGDDATSQVADEAEPVQEVVEDVLDEDDIYMNEILPECLEVLVGYLQAPTANDQLSFIQSGSIDEASMEAFYKDAALSDINPETIKLVGRSKLQLKDGEMIMTQWENEDGDLFDAVFSKEEIGWKLDWHHFVRYGIEPWPLFTAGSGTDEGEFRMLARERYPEKRAVSDSIEVMLYHPRHGHMDEAGLKTPVEPIALDSHSGKMLSAAFSQLNTRENFFGSTIPRINPDEMIRVRLSVRRINDDGRVHYRVTDVATSHWLNSDELALTLEEGAAENEAVDGAAAE